MCPLCGEPCVAVCIRAASSLSAGTLTVLPSALVWCGMPWASSCAISGCASSGSRPVNSGLYVGVPMSRTKSESSKTVAAAPPSRKVFCVPVRVAQNCLA